MPSRRTRLGMFTPAFSDVSNDPVYVSQRPGLRDAVAVGDAIPLEYVLGAVLPAQRDDPTALAGSHLDRLDLVGGALKIDRLLLQFLFLGQRSSHRVSLQPDRLGALGHPRRDFRRVRDRRQ